MRREGTLRKGKPSNKRRNNSKKRRGRPGQCIDRPYCLICDIMPHRFKMKENIVKNKKALNKFILS